MSAKSKSALSESPNTKASPPTSRVSKGVTKSKLSNADSASPVQNTRISIDRSPATKPTIERRSPKIGTPPTEKKTTPTRISKPSELQTELNLAQEELKKAKEKLVLVENEKAAALQTLIETQKLADEANEKLQEAMVAQKRAEEDSEIEKFRAVEMEQAGIEAVHKKEEEWKKELESVKNQHSVDLNSLQITAQELENLKQELKKICDTKELAIAHAEDAKKTAESYAQKVEALTTELATLKNSLDSRVEVEAIEKDKFVSELKSEVDLLRRELEHAKTFEEQLAEKEANLEKLNIDLEAARMAESYARSLVGELHERSGDLASQAEQAKRLERSASESLESVMKQLELSNDSLHDAQNEIASLKEKVGLLEISIRRQKGEMEENKSLLETAKKEASEMEKKVESLVFELEAAKEEKIHALNHEQLAASSIQTLLEEKNKLINELESSRDEEEKSKKALEGIASALHEVSSEARESKEKLLSLQVENENYEAEMKDLKLVLEATNQKYESMLDDAKHKIETLKNSIEQSRNDHQKLKVEWEEKELRLTKKSEEEFSSMENEITRLVNLLKMAEEKAYVVKEEEDHWRNAYKEAETEVINLKETLDESKAENIGLKSALMDRETALHNVLMENEELESRESASLKKMEELSKLLEEYTTKKKEEENVDLMDCEKDYDMLPKVVEFSEQNGKGEIEPKMEVIDDASNHESIHKEEAFEFDGFTNGQLKENGDKEKDTITTTTTTNNNNNNRNNDDDSAAEVDLKMWESCKIEEEELDRESFEDEVNSKVASGGDTPPDLSSTENIENGETSPSEQQTSSQKKKKPLFHKFGNLLKKKKSTSSDLKQ